MEVLQPTNLDDALAILADRGETVTPIAGGTDLLVAWHEQRRWEGTFLDLSRLGELSEVRLTDDALHIGGMATYWDVAADRAVAEAFPLLEQAARQVGSIQIQMRGTWAGNIANASPAADGVLALLAYGATVILASQQGTCEVPLDRYYHGYKQTARMPNQIITAIRVPRRTYDVELFEKVGSRAALTISKVGMAVTHNEQTGWVVAANSVAPFVCRCPALEKLLTDGCTVRSPDDLLPAVDSDTRPIDDVRSTARYRRIVLSRIIYFGLRDAAPGFE
ncbi:MAG: FAD binding domain-containing protein [Phycisphaerales bacterium]|nr:FAD binding domain-containing protein [Phycisphaerales bacterium]